MKLVQTVLKRRSCGALGERQAYGYGARGGGGGGAMSGSSRPSSCGRGRGRQQTAPNNAGRACWGRGRSGQGEKNEEASRSVGVNALGGGGEGGRGLRCGGMREGGGAARWGRCHSTAAAAARCRSRATCGPFRPRIESRYLSKFRSSDSCGLWAYFVGLGRIQTTEPNVRLSLFLLCHSFLTI
jgi:hypothetical protein